MRWSLALTYWNGWCGGSWVITADTGNPYLEKLAKLRVKTERVIREAVNEGGMTVFDLQEVTGENWRYLADVAGKLGTEPEDNPH